MDTFLFISYVNEGTSPGSARSNSSSIALALFTKVSSRNRTKALTLREGTFFLGGGGGGLGPQRVGSSVKVSTKGGGLYPLFQLFKGRVTPFPEFLMGIFVMLFSIFL